jgi:hypothetical protein
LRGSGGAPCGAAGEMLTAKRNVECVLASIHDSTFQKLNEDVARPTPRPIVTRFVVLWCAQMISSRASLCLLGVLLAAHCRLEVPAALIPSAARRVGENVYMQVMARGKGPPAKCGELYGYNANVVGLLGVSDNGEDHRMLRRDELNSDWRTLILSMREGDKVRAWMRLGSGNRFREYDVFLARVDRLDSHGLAQPQEHDHLCR